jgi:hypothetical protein
MLFPSFIKCFTTILLEILENQKFSEKKMFITKYFIFKFIAKLIKCFVSKHTNNLNSSTVGDKKIRILILFI